MIKFNFDKSVIFTCEDTARVLVYNPTEKNKHDIIEVIDKQNYICAGVLTDIEQTAQTFVYYFNCPVSSNENNIKKIESTFT